MTALAIDNIGLLVTNDAALGTVRSASSRRCVVIEDGASLAVERPAGAAGDERIDAGGRCVIPGFVDSHTHLVFAGDRGDEFAARHGRRAVRRGRHPRDHRGDARGERRRLRALAARASRARRCAPASRTSRSSRATALDVETRRRLCEVAARAHRRRDLPRRARRARRVRGPRRRLRRARVRRDARRVRAARALDRRLLRGGRLRRRPVAGGARGRPGGGARAARPRQPARRRARACGSPSSWAPHRWTTAPTSPTPTSRRSPAATPSRRSCPRPTSRTRQPYPDARRVIDAGRARRDRDQLQPRLELHDRRWRSASRSPCATCA